MARSDSTALLYFDNLKKQFAQQQYAIAASFETGVAVPQKNNQSTIFFELLQQNIDSPGLLTADQRDSIIDYLQFIQ